MALTINTNVASLNAQRNLSGSQSALGTAMQRLSSGLRINSAKDDSAGLAISDRMTSQIRGLNQAVRNANDGISVAQTAEGAMGEITNILQRMRELAVQSANDSNSESDRKSLQAEVSQLINEIDRIAQTTEFNETKLLDGSGSTLNFQVGARGTTSDQIGIKIEDLDMTTDTLGVDGVDLEASDFDIDATLKSIDDAIGTVSSARGDLGAIQNRFESTIANLSNISENVSAARSRIMDADIAQETSNMTKFNILQQAGVSILAQANQAPQLALSLLG
ncbi:flagellin domain-containing protein [Geoalkalibacter halelectricus]|uniref:Flagellin n=1 Tax=Geoalkalibacter halelectricus TaxID=2847045 RepID=A0ABY5ZUC3_9BACT|nr:flagellin domain-containing protein [Geoalkalibacter halelectricus]MDO3377962.1 flagellin domain-containing protein [Geoalkalibacter halelectricus]UWZ81535.1 flagellin FliC [Geoalkalibacter halelectricus]